MDRKEHIAQEVIETLTYLDRAEKIETDPFFSARLREKMKNLAQEKAHLGFRSFKVGIITTAAAQRLFIPP